MGSENGVDMRGWTALGEMGGNPQEVLADKIAEVEAEKKKQEEKDKK